MSLLNDVLRDLQMRGVYDVEPLTGLEPVAELATHHARNTYALPAFAAIAVVSALLFWRPAIDGLRPPSAAGLASDSSTYSRSLTSDDELPIAAEASVAVAGYGSSGVTPIAGDGSNQVAEVGDVLVVASPALEASPIVNSAKVTQAPATKPTATAAQTATAGDTGSVTDTVVNVKPEPTPITEKTAVFRREPLGASDRAATAVARGLTAMRSSDFRTAERLFREALAVDSGDGDVWGYLYSVLVRAARPAAAEETLRQGLAAAKDPAPLAKLYARMLLDRGEKDTAVRVLRTHRPASGADTEYDAFLAALLQQLGRHSEAGDIYRTLLSVDETSGSWWIGLGISEDGLGNRQDALSAFDHAQRTGMLSPTLEKYARRRISELKIDE